MEDISVDARDTPWLVDVFHAKKPFSFVMLGIKIAGDGGYERTEMQLSRRGRGKAPNIIFTHHNKKPHHLG
ncbi:MAG: hypothetical protein AXW14_11060 [Alteromonas sp. Nap_26]|nr:MAG: hypothetical protein AXW14_11060 [Alteromonas sp. Nap_26]